MHKVIFATVVLLLWLAVAAVQVNKEGVVASGFVQRAQRTLQVSVNTADSASGYASTSAGVTPGTYTGEMDTDSEWGGGVGINIENSDVTITNCIISNNAANVSLQRDEHLNPLLFVRMIN